MKTAEALDRSGIDPTLFRAVVRRVGADAMRDVNRGGADAGFPGFTYTRDCVAFFKKHRKAIVELVERMADDLGESPAEMVAGFQCLAGRELQALRNKHRYSDLPEHEKRKALADYMPSVSRCLYGGRLTDDDDTVANALAWFALEEVARAFDE